MFRWGKVIFVPSVLTPLGPTKTMLTVETLKCFKKSRLAVPLLEGSGRGMSSDHPFAGAVAHKEALFKASAQVSSIRRKPVFFSITNTPGSNTLFRVEALKKGQFDLKLMEAANYRLGDKWLSELKKINPWA